VCEETKTEKRKAVREADTGRLTEKATDRESANPTSDKLSQSGAIARVGQHHFKLLTGFRQGVIDDFNPYELFTLPGRKH